MLRAHFAISLVTSWCIGISYQYLRHPCESPCLRCIPSTTQRCSFCCSRSTLPWRWDQSLILMLISWDSLGRGKWWNGNAKSKQYAMYKTRRIGIWIWIHIWHHMSVILSHKTSEKEGETRWTSNKFRANNSFPPRPKQVNLKCFGDTVRSLAPTPAPTLPPCARSCRKRSPQENSAASPNPKAVDREGRQKVQHRRDDHGESYIESLWLNWNEAAWTTWKRCKKHGWMWHSASIAWPTEVKMSQRHMLQTEVLSARSRFCAPLIVLLRYHWTSSSKTSQSKHVWQQANNKT